MTTHAIINTHRHVQSVASTSWSVAHNLDTEAPAVDIWLDIGGTITKVLPLSLVVVDSSNLTITFTAPQLGEAVVA